MSPIRSLARPLIAGMYVVDGASALKDPGGRVDGMGNIMKLQVKKDIMPAGNDFTDKILPFTVVHFHPNFYEKVFVLRKAVQKTDCVFPVRKIQCNNWPVNLHS